MANVDLQGVMDGLRQVEALILQRAAQRGLHGFKLEWNDGLDFGHLMDPVPVALLTEGGMVSGHFSLRDLALVPGHEPPPVTSEIEKLVSQLETGPHAGPPLHDPPGAP